jgi:hypothetical protein
MNNQPTELHVLVLQSYYVDTAFSLTISAVIASLIVAFRRFGHHFDWKREKGLNRPFTNW